MGVIDYVLGGRHWDVVLYTNTVALLFAGLSHIFKRLGSIEALGFEVSAFMPFNKKTRAPSTVPNELVLLMDHALAMIGAAQIALASLQLLASFSEWPRGKKLAIRTMRVYFLIVLLLEYSHPAGTGAKGSPTNGFHGPYVAGTLFAINVLVRFAE